MVEQLISSTYETSDRFLRSADLVRDFDDPGALEGYWLTDFSRNCLAQIADGFRLDSCRRAWRLTGDFGSGKSSFALLLAKAVRDPRSLPGRLRGMVSESLVTVKKQRFFPLLITGSREPMSTALVRALHGVLSSSFARGAKSALQEKIEKSLSSKRINDQLAIDLLKEVTAKIIQNGKGDGVLLILDEVGKFLEYAALNQESQDVFFLQQLAEAACRSGNQQLVVICLLHQGVNAYSEQLAKATQKEWDKIAGRFDEIIFHQPLDQVAQLVAAALHQKCNALPAAIGKNVSASMEQAIKLGWYGTSASRDTLRKTALRLFPLDPMLLPVLVRFFRRFGQNERSLFSFICSYEPFGLRAFAHNPLDADTMPYQLADFYDYVRANFGHRLGSASYRSHWNVIESAIEAYQPKDVIELRILKTVGLLNLLNADDLMPTEEAVAWAVAGNLPRNRHSVTKCLHDIAETPTLYYRGKGRGFSVWPHTSVDLDARLEEARRAIPAIGTISEAIISQLPAKPIVARAHYIKTGNLRYFDVVYCQPHDLSEVAVKHTTRADGFILLPLCETESDTKQCEEEAAKLDPRSDAIRLIAVPKPLSHLHQSVLDAKHWEWVQQETPDLNNDKIARDEVAIYLQEARNRLQAQIQAYLGLNRYCGETSLKWFYADHEGKCHIESLKARKVLELLSSLCDTFFQKAPQIKNELVNRHNISSAAAGARMRLVDLMFTAAEKSELGMPAERKPPEKSMYFSVLKGPNLHRQHNGSWVIGLPHQKQDVCSVRPVLQRIKQLLSNKPDIRIPISEILGDLRKPPYGLRDGLFPLFMAVIAIEGESEVAFYENGTFLRDVGRDAFLRMTKAPESFEIQLCRIEGVRSALFQQLATTLEVSSKNSDVELLDVVRNLCEFVARLPEYARNTRRLDKSTLAVRNVILNAREPVRMVFHDLPEACGFNKFTIGKSVSVADATRFVHKLKNALDELRSAFPNLQQRMEAAIAKEFGYDKHNAAQYRPKLAVRTERLLVLVTENKLKAFTFRLFDEVLAISDWLNSVGSVLALRPPDRWKDEDEDTFHRELETMAGHYKRTESAAFTSVGGQGIRVAVTQADGAERQEVVQIDEDEQSMMREIQEQISAIIQKNKRVGLAAASRAIWSQIKAPEDRPHD
jgi:hypothetical protein